VEILEKVKSVPTYQRWLLIGLLISFLLLGYYYLFYQKNSKEMHKLKEEFSRLEFLLKNAELNAKRFPELEAEVEELKRKLTLALAQLPSKKEIPDLLTQISFLGRRAGLEFLLFSPTKERFKEFYAEVPVNIEVFGQFHDVARFFDMISKLNRIVNVSELNMEEPTVLEDKFFLTAKYTATAFRFLDEKEIEEMKKREEEQKKKKGKR
jgi:type IV pilus assembly protein PilO